MGNKIYRYPFYCTKCKRTVIFNSIEEINTICKICKLQMDQKQPYLVNLKKEEKKIKRNIEYVNNTNEKNKLNSYKTQPLYAPPKSVTVTCPYCNSTNTKKISLTSKAVNTALFGILGTKRHKQWHCNNCGSDW